MKENEMENVVLTVPRTNHFWCRRQHGDTRRKDGLERARDNPICYCPHYDTCTAVCTNPGKSNHSTRECGRYSRVEDAQTRVSYQAQGITAEESATIEDCCIVESHACGSTVIYGVWSDVKLSGLVSIDIYFAGLCY